MKFGPMGEFRARQAALLIVTAVLGACATQDVSRESLSLETEAEAECARECEYIHGGTVRGCRGSEAGATRSVGMISDCVSGAYAELRNCYVTCDVNEQ